MKVVRSGLVRAREFELIETELSPAAGEVLIEIAACGICSSEIPRYADKKEEDPPVYLGHEPSGTVAQISARVTCRRSTASSFSATRSAAFWGYGWQGGSTIRADRTRASGGWPSTWAWPQH